VSYIRKARYNQVNDYFANPKTSIPKSLTDNSRSQKVYLALHQLYDLLTKKREERHAMSLKRLRHIRSSTKRRPLSLPRTRGDA
jgi:ribonuclease R